MSIKPIKTEKLDATDAIFFARQLEHTKANTYDIKYPELKARSLFPVSTEAGQGAETIKYEQFDQVGVAKIISSYAHDLPRADIKGKEFRSPVRSLGDSYGYNVQEIAAARMAGKSLEQRRASAAKRAMMQLENTLAFFGDSDHDIPGFLSNPNIPVTTVPADGTGSSTEFEDKTADQIIRDVNLLINGILDTTKGIEQANTVLMPIKQYTQLATMPRSSGSDLTVLEFLKRNHPGVSFEWLNELDAPTGFGGLDVMVAYRRDPEVLTMEIPWDFQQFPPQEQGLEFVINCHERFGGVIVYYPLACAFAKGI